MYIQESHSVINKSRRFVTRRLVISHQTEMHLIEKKIKFDILQE